METRIKNKNNILKIHDNYTSTNRLSEETYIIGKGTGLIYNKDINYYIPIKELT